MNYELLDSIIRNPQYLWGIYVIFILLSFIIVSRLWVFIKRNFSHKKKLFITDTKPIKPAKIVKVARKKRVLFPLLYHLFTFSLPENYWMSFLWGTLSFLLVLLILFSGGKIGIGIIIVYIFSLIVFFVYLANKRQKTQQYLIEQFPLFLQGMSRSMQAGYTFEQALDFVKTEVPNPLQYYLAKLSKDLHLGIDLAQAIDDFAQKINHESVYFFSESTILQLKTGANLVELFQKIGKIIEEKLKLDRDIRSFTSQGKMSGLLVAGLWPLSLLLFWWISPEHVSVLFNTSAGNGLLLISLLLEAVGFYFIWKIVSIKI